MVIERQRLELGNWIVGYSRSCCRKLRSVLTTLVQIKVSHNLVNTCDHAAYSICHYAFAVRFSKSKVQQVHETGQR